MSDKDEHNEENEEEEEEEGEGENEEEEEEKEGEEEEEERKKEKNQKKIKKEEEKENKEKILVVVEDAHAEKREDKKKKLASQVMNDSIKRMGAMKSLGIRDEQKFYNLADAVMCEWEVTDDHDWSWRHKKRHHHRLYSCVPWYRRSVADNEYHQRQGRHQATRRR